MPLEATNVTCGDQKIEMPSLFWKMFDPNVLLHYYNNTKVWMMGGNVLLLLNNASSHVILDSVSNSTVHFLPPNTTSHLEPLDANIIQSFKCKYHKEHV